MMAAVLRHFLVGFMCTGVQQTTNDIFRFAKLFMHFRAARVAAQAENGEITS